MSTLREQLATLRSDRRSSAPLYRTSFALVLTTATNGALGLIFWVAAARLYSADVVGLGAGGISAIQLVATVGWVGLQFSLLRYVPLAGWRARQVTAAVYAAGTVAVVAVAVVFLLVGAEVLNVSYFHEDVRTAVAFCVAAVVWSIYSLQDSALVASRHALLVPLQTGSYNLIKIVVLISVASFDEPWAILGAWMFPAAVMVLVVNAFLFSVALKKGTQEPELPSTGTVTRYSAGQTSAALMSWIPDLLVPLLVLGILGQEANAYFYAAWTIGFSMRLLLMNLSTALVGEAAHDSSNTHALVTLFAKLSALALLPMLAVGLLAPSLILQIFGPEYTAGVTLLRFLSLGLVPFAFTGAVMSIERLRGRVRAPLVLTGVANVVFVALCPLLLPPMGIAGGGVAWLVGQVTSAAVAAVSLRSLRKVRSRGRREA
jgi:O-antigen/teichoic acid export membrane protein